MSFGEADLFFCVSGDLASQRALPDDRGELPRVQELNLAHPTNIKVGTSQP
jgi:hypothetical protein